MPVDHFESYRNTIRTMIPLLQRKRALDQDQAQFQAVMGQRKMALAQEAEQAKLDIAQKQFDSLMKQQEAEIKWATDRFSEHSKAGSQDGANFWGNVLQKYGRKVPRDEKGNVVMMPQSIEGFTDPYFDQLGNLVQKNKETGKISKISSPARGMMIESTPEGGFSVRTNMPTKQMTTRSRGEIEQKQIASVEGLKRISNIVKNYKPEWLEIPKRAGVKWSGIKAKFGVNPPPERRAEMEEFARFRQDSLENINLYIKEITGAQMSEKEANRLRQAQPDPGEGIFDGDDPVSFKSKLMNQYIKLQAALARYTMYRNQNIDENTIKEMVNSGQVVSFDEMERIINRRAKKVKEEIQQQTPGLDTDTMFNMVKMKLKEEFGLD